MDEKVTNLVLERLNRMEKTLQSDILPIKEDIRILKESVQRIDARMSSMDHYLAGFYTEQRWCNDEIDSMKQRIFKCEKHNETNENKDKPDQPQD